MKKSKRILLLCVVLVLICTATVILTLTEEKQEQVRTSGETILAVPTDTVTGISWSYEEEDSFRFVKEEGVWYVSDDRAFPVSEEKLNKVLALFSDLRATFSIEEVTDFDQYGLKEPECTLQLTTTNGSHTVRLGSYSPMDQLRYADIGDGKVYLVSQDPMATLYLSLSEAIEHDTLPAFEQITGVEIAGTHNLSILRTEDSGYSYSSEDLYFLQQGEAYLPLKTSSMTQYVNTVAGLELLDYTTYTADDSILESCGLLEPELSVTVRFRSGDTDRSCTVHIGQDAAQLAQAKEAEAAGEEAVAVTRYVRVGDSPIIYVLDDLDYGILSAAGYNDLRHNEVFWADFADVTGLELALEGASHTFTSTQNEEEERSWLFGETQIDVSAVESAIAQITVTEFTEEAPTGKEELRLTLLLDNEAYPQSRLTFYRFDGDSCLAQIDGESIGYVSRSSVMDLVEALQAIIL